MSGEEPPKVYEYTGDGSAYHSGVPMRDLTQTDVDNLDDDQRKVLERSPVYRRLGARGGKGQAAPGPKVDDQGHSLVPADEGVVQSPAADEEGGGVAAEGAEASPESPAPQNKSGTSRSRR